MTVIKQVSSIVPDTLKGRERGGWAGKGGLTEEQYGECNSGQRPTTMRLGIEIALKVQTSQ